MVDASGELVITFNGEIYNFKELRSRLEARGHRFRSNSDTEVLLEAYREWGTECPGHLNGMFAFAIYDVARRHLFLARDRAGEKPLFYFQEGEAFHFASELKGLLADASKSRKIDPQALSFYLAFGYIPGERCLLKGFRKLPPGHAAVFDLGTNRLHRWRYWNLPAGDVDAQADAEGLTDEFERLLEDAVERQLVADVPVGILLSGGLDSSLITAMARRSSNRIKTFTIRFPGAGKLDETEHARLIARNFGTEHVELAVGSVGDELLPVMARQFDDPIADTSVIPTFLVSKLVREHCTVALGGDGGDELFGGYTHYPRIARMEEKRTWLPSCVGRGISWAATELLPVGTRGRNWLKTMDGNSSLPHLMTASFFDRTTRRRLLPGLPDDGFSPEAELWGASLPGCDPIARATRTDFQNYLPDDILVKVDRASMLNSLEMRAPLLDFRIIEFAFGAVPSHLRATRLERKVLLKRLALRVLPANFDSHRKQGFSVPLGDWLRHGTLGRLFREVLLESDLGFNKTLVADLLRGQRKGRSNADRLFALLMLELWRREYQVSL